MWRKERQISSPNVAIIAENKKESSGRKVNTYTARPHVSSVDSRTYAIVACSFVRARMRPAMQQAALRRSPRKPVLGLKVATGWKVRRTNSSNFLVRMAIASSVGRFRDVGQITITTKIQLQFSVGVHGYPSTVRRIYPYSSSLLLNFATRWGINTP